ncbi:MAG: thiamine-phosphate kinase [Desulfobacterales bacterium]
MPHPALRDLLRFYFITDDSAALPVEDQVRLALAGGASMVQYRNKRFTAGDFESVRSLRDLCRVNGVPLIVNDHLLLAKAVGADGVHVGQEDDAPGLSRRLMGPKAIVGVSVSTPEELRRTDLGPCDYIGSGPVFATGTKTDAKPVRGIEGLAEMVALSPLPVVAIGGIDVESTPGCLKTGAAGVAVISAVSRAADPLARATAIGAACGCSPRPALAAPWDDEFDLIDRILEAAGPSTRSPLLVDRAGDDACRLRGLVSPVISTDTQREGVHFVTGWHPPEAIGEKAVEITFSDLAASFARPVALFVNLGMPRNRPASIAEAIYRGIGNALDRHQAALGGGNVSAAEALTIELFAVGEGRPDLFPARSTARPGDGLYATGPLGLARCGLLALEKGDRSWQGLIDRFRYPRARFDAAEVLAGHGVRCVMDLSDGLAGDAAHIARSSGVTIALDARAAGRHPELRRFCGRFGLDPETVVLQGGEDYELLFACPEPVFDRLKDHLPDAVQVGRCLHRKGAPIQGLPPELKSFQHGAG